MKIEPSIDQAFQDHADRIASGFAAMSPKPARQPFIHNTNMTETTAAEPVTETAESSTQQTIRESGLVGGFELTWTPPADIEALTTDLLGKKERAELIDLNAACIRLADEVSKANNIPVNPAKVALAWRQWRTTSPMRQDHRENCRWCLLR